MNDEKIHQEKPKQKDLTAKGRVTLTIAMSAAKQIERPLNLTTADALQLVSSFFPKEWKHLTEKDVSIKRSELGISNEVYFVKRINGDGVREPNNVVVRKYNKVIHDENSVWAAFQFMCASHQDQAVIQMELAHHSLGPKQYGFFPGGRIEEFIDCRRLTFDDAYKPEIVKEIAINMARIHALDLPLKKPGYKFIDVMRAMHAELKQYRDRFEDFGNSEIKRIADHDFQSLLDWMEPMLELGSKQKMVFTNWDPHFGNIAVLNRPKADGLKVIIFDFEGASYNMRGKDLGLFLVSRSGYHPVVREDRRLESNDMFYPFLQEYINEYGKIEEGIESGGRDSLDHLMVESLLGGMVGFLIFIFFQLKIIALKPNDNPVLLTYTHSVPLWFEAVIECEKAIKERFPNIYEILSP